MVTEYFICPTDYEKWFRKNEVSCNTGILLNKYTGKRNPTETAMDLTDCLKDFFMTVKGVVIKINNDSLYNSRYLLKPIISYLLHLKQGIYFQILKLLNESKVASTGKFIGAEYIDFDKLVEEKILTKDEVTLIRYPIELQFANLVTELDTRDVYIATNNDDEDIREFYFSIKKNMHFDMDPTPQFVMKAPFEFEPGLINLKHWTVYELYRLFKMTEICAKVISETSEVPTSILANGFDASEMISVFENL